MHHLQVQFPISSLFVSQRTALGYTILSVLAFFWSMFQYALHLVHIQLTISPLSSQPPSLIPFISLDE